ncbi:MAG: hypothetical protein ACREXS_07780, partial [Gammaproteobacteria bacterium]
RADPIMARADTTLNKRPDIYTQSFLTAIGVSLLANRVESIYTVAALATEIWLCIPAIEIADSEHCDHPRNLGCPESSVYINQRSKNVAKDRAPAPLARADNVVLLDVSSCEANNALHCWG